MNKQKRNLILQIASGAIVVAAVILVGVVGSTGRGSEKGTLTQYYTAMYSEEGGGMDAIVDCLVPALQQDYYNQVTVGGTNFNQLSAWRLEAMNMVGDNIRVKVEIINDLDESSTDLAQIKMTYPTADRYHVVAFQMTLSGSQGSEAFVGVMPLVQMDGTWYMTTADAGLKRVVEGAAQ
jgi:hypothetical protein